MHDDEVAIDDDLVRRLLAAQFPAWASLPICPVASTGTDNALYRLGDDMVVRLPRIHWAANGIEREQRWLARLAPHLPVAIPVALGAGTPGEGYPWHWSVHSWLDGENPVVGNLADADSLARDLARFIAALRRIDSTGGPAASRSGPLAERDPPTRRAIEASGDLIDTRPIIEAWEAALAVPAWSGRPVWLHADLAPGNVLLRGGRLDGVIDFSGTGVGDPACDLPVAWNLLPPVSRGIFRAALQVDDETWARGRGWALSIALIQLPYYHDRNPPLAASSRHVIRELLAEEGR